MPIPNLISTPRLAGLVAAVALAIGATLPATAGGQSSQTEGASGGIVQESPVEVQAEVPIPAGKKPDRGGDAPEAVPAPAPAVAAAPAAATPTRLPFTGIDLLTLTGVALVMTGLGLGLHKLLLPPSRA